MGGGYADEGARGAGGSQVADRRKSLVNGGASNARRGAATAGSGSAPAVAVFGGRWGWGFSMPIRWRRGRSVAEVVESAVLSATI